MYFFQAVVVSTFLSRFGVGWLKAKGAGKVLERGGQSKVKELGGKVRKELPNVAASDRFLSKPTQRLSF